MEEMNNRSSFSKGLKSLKDKSTDVTLRILAFILAVISWFILSITQYPTITKTIPGVHVDFSMDGTMASELGLEALDYKAGTVDVVISGMNYEIGTYNDNDLIATVNLDNVTKEGTYNLDINVKSSHTTDRCSIVSVSPATVEVTFDSIIEKNVEIRPDYPMVTAEDGYTINDVKVNPSNITIKGPKSILETVNSASAKVSNSAKLTDNTTLSTNDIVFYDSDGKALDNSKFEVQGRSSFDVDFTIYKKKNLELLVNISDVPEGFDRSTLPIKLSLDTVSVLTSDLNDNPSEKVVLGKIPINEIDLKKNFQFKIPIDTDEINTSESDTVVVSFNSEGYTSAEFTLNTDNIDLISAPAKLTAEIDDKEPVTVTLFGPEEVIEELSDENIHAKINLSDIHGTGSFTKEASIYIPEHNDVWSFGTTQIPINVSQPKNEDSSGADSTEN